MQWPEREQEKHNIVGTRTANAYLGPLRCRFLALTISVYLCIRPVPLAQELA
jgi:hypothetical protein